MMRSSKLKQYRQLHHQLRLQKLLRRRIYHLRHLRHSRMSIMVMGLDEAIGIIGDEEEGEIHEIIN